MNRGSTRNDPRTSRAATAEAAPQLADGIELIGEYRESGYREPPFLARRADGRMIQMPRLLFLVAEEADGRRGVDEIAERVTDAFGRPVSADNVRVLVAKLRPLGVLAAADGSSPTAEHPDPLLALRLRAAVVPERVVHALTGVFRPLFLPPVVAAAVAALLAFDAWLFFSHGVAASARELVYRPVTLLVVLALVVLGAAFHEIGHATGARYGGARPGEMGVGIYVVWPAFYTDVTDAYRLDRRGRLRVDVGGVYFNAVFMLAVGGAYFLTGFEPLLVLVVVQHVQALQQLLPFLRLDGYYVLSDLTGVPDLFGRLRPTLRSLVPGGGDDRRAHELKGWVRAVVTAWVVLVVPLLLVVFGLLAVNAPRIFATVWDSLHVHADEARTAFGDGDLLRGFAGGLELGLLALPALGLALTLGRGGKRLARGTRNWSEGSPPRRGALVVVAAGTAALLAFVWWPNGDYRPIQPGERGTIQGGVVQLRHVGSGRPALTEDRHDELGGARFRHSGGGGAREPEPREDDAPARTAPVETATAPTATAPTATTSVPTETAPQPTAPTATATGETPTGETATETTVTVPDGPP
jgi:putative peptide zinc metalloprotease protein